MHVLHYSPNFPSRIGGREVFVQGLVNYLQKFGIRQSVVTNSNNKSENIIEVTKNLTVISLPMKRIGAYLFLTNLSSKLQDAKYDVINVHGYGEYFGDVACILKFLGQVHAPLVLTTHGIAGLNHGYMALDPRSSIKPTQRIARVFHLLYDFTMGRLEMKAFDKVILLSEEEKRSLTKIGLECRKALEIPIAINELFFNSSISSDRNSILYVGRIDPYKGLDILVRAVKELRSKDINLKCIIIGKDFDYRLQLQSLIDHLQLSDWVKIEDHVAQQDLLQFYSSALVTVLPSSSEGFPLVLVESMATGTPFIATPVGAIPELIDSSKAGLLVPVGDHKSLAQAIIHLLNDKSLWSSMSANAKIFSQKFTWDRVANMYYEVYRELTN